MRKMKPQTVRMLTSVGVIALVCVGLAAPNGTGTPASFGLGEFFLLCPLGGLESLVASRTPIPRALISLAVVAIACLFVGRAWCAWGCPAQVVRSLFGSKVERPSEPACKASLKETFASDRRLWVLGGILLATLIVGFPVFCLFCPVGLTVGTVVSIWRLVQFNDVNWGLLVFPAALVVEMVVMKKWCTSLCPIAGLLSLLGRFRGGLRPRVMTQTCLRANGEGCHACHEACPEAIDLHAPDAAAQLADCTRCAECVHACPTHSVELRAKLLERTTLQGGK